MPVTIFDTIPVRSKEDDDGPASAAHREAVRSAKAVESVGRALGAMTIATGRSNSGIEQSIAGFYGEPKREPIRAAKVDVESLHPRAKAHVSRLSGNAARLLDLMARADEAHRGSQLVSAPASDIARALSIKQDEAEAARGELEARDLIRFYDNASGDRGYRVRA